MVDGWFRTIAAIQSNGPSKRLAVNLVSATNDGSWPQQAYSRRNARALPSVELPRSRTALK
jgi:hypothetical protein